MTTKYLTTIGVVPNSDREINDFYATDPACVDDLLDREKLSQLILEPCCGDGSISKRLQSRGYTVQSSDLIDRGFGEVMDFFWIKQASGFDIVTNPPYKNVERYIRHGLDIVNHGSKVCMFLKLTSLEGKKRYDAVFKTDPPVRIYVYVSRAKCAKNGDFSAYDSSAICFAWFVWEKGYQGQPQIYWIDKEK